MDGDTKKDVLHATESSERKAVNLGTNLLILEGFPVDLPGVILYIPCLTSSLREHHGPPKRSRKACTYFNVSTWEEEERRFRFTMGTTTNGPGVPEERVHEE